MPGQKTDKIFLYSSRANSFRAINLNLSSSIGKFAVVLLQVVFLTGCYLSLDLGKDSIRSINITSHKIEELSAERVVIRLSGDCPAQLDQIGSNVEGENFLVKNNYQKFPQIEEMNLSSQAMISICEPDGVYQSIYLVKNPNDEREIKFEHTGVSKKGVALELTSYALDYKRPPLPVPSLRGSDQIYTNQLSYELEGFCISERITGLEYRLDAKLDSSQQWKTLECETEVGKPSGESLDHWKIALSLVPEGPAVVEGKYVIEVRSVNDKSIHQYSEILAATIHYDTVKPTTIPALSGVLHGKDNIYGEWMKSEYPQVGWGEDSDIYKVEVKISNADESIVLCASKEALNSGSLQFMSQDCAGQFLDGETYRIKLEGFDRAGNRSTVSSTKNFTVDRTAPMATWVETPPSNTQFNFASFRWSGSVSGGSPLNTDTGVCILDNLSNDCPYGAYEVNNLEAGKLHTLKVNVYDVAGNFTTLSYSWDVESEKVPPSCVFDQAEAEFFGKNSLNVGFQCSDEDSGVRFVECRWNSHELWQPCTTSSSQTVSGLQSGAFQLQVQAQDNAGNRSAVIQKIIYVDFTDPVISFVQTPLKITNKTNDAISYTVLESGTASGLRNVECRLDGGAFAECISSPPLLSAFSMLPLSDLSEGAHTFEVKATDKMGNESTASFMWEVDITPPAMPIMPSDGESGLRPEWTWSGGGGGNGTFRFKLNDADLSSNYTETNKLYFTPENDLGFGNNTLYVQEQDDAGNWSAVASTTFEAKCNKGEFLVNGNCAACAEGTYQDEYNIANACKPAPIGSYVPTVGSKSVTACPVNSTTVQTGSTSLMQCLGNGGYYECEDGTCNPVGADYFSELNDNTRTQCPLNTFSSGEGVGAAVLEDCLPGVDYYFNGSNILTAVGNGFYSPYRSKDIFSCTNTPANAIAVIYSSSGRGENNCDVSAVLSCFSSEYIIEGISCVDNSPNGFAFTSVNGADPGSVVESNQVTVSGFDGPLTATCTDCLNISLNGVWKGTEVEGVMPGDKLSIRRQAPLSFTSSVTASLTLGQTTSTPWMIQSRSAYSCTLAGFGTVPHASSVTAYEFAEPQSTNDDCTAVATEERICNDGVLTGSFTNKECKNGCKGTLWGNVSHGFQATAYSTKLPSGACSGVSQVQTCQNGVMSGNATTYKETQCLSGCSSLGLKSGDSRVFYEDSRADNCSTVGSATRTCTNGVASGPNYTASSCSNWTYGWSGTYSACGQNLSSSGTCGPSSQSGRLVTNYSPAHECTAMSCWTVCGSYQQGETVKEYSLYSICERW